MRQQHRYTTRSIECDGTVTCTSASNSCVVDPDDRYTSSTNAITICGQHNETSDTSDCTSQTYDIVDTCMYVVFEREAREFLIISHFHVSITSEEYNKSTLEYKLNCNENSNTNQRLNTGTQDSHACLPLASSESCRCVCLCLARADFTSKFHAETFVYQVRFCH